jgi:prepilin-type N-terminal cleavage/methylation domain-containing protein
MKKTSTSSGFTLIELLVVVGIITVLAVVVLVSVKPGQRLSETRDARRAQDMNQILTAVHSCAVDKKDNATLATCLGSYVAGETYEIVDVGISGGCNSVCTTATSATHCLPLSAALDDYFVNLPRDPNNTVSGHSGYAITVTNGMTVIDACGAENGAMKVSR